MMPTPTKPRPGDPDFQWQQAYPTRWRAELAALRAKGWKYTIRGKGPHRNLVVQYPHPREHGTFVALVVQFPLTYPHFPAQVFDPDNALELGRHRHPRDGSLCYVEPHHYRPDDLLADLLQRQVPQLVAASAATSHDVQVEEPGARVNPGDLLRPEGPDILTPVDLPPQDVADGALVVRFEVGSTTLGGGIVTHVFTGVDRPPLRPDIPEPWVNDLYTATAYGSWIRDPDFDPREPATTTWLRIRSQLKPLEVKQQPRRHDIRGQLLEVIGLLVPAEFAYRTTGEQWVFLLVMEPSEQTEPDTKIVQHRRSQTIDRTAALARTPDAATLQTKTATIVGVGALGNNIAHNLACAGISRLDLIDPDRVDIDTHLRQYAFLATAGASKASALASQLEYLFPYTTIHDHRLDAANLYSNEPDTASDQGKALAAVLQADILIDATANPTATRFLAALRRSAGKPFLHTSATAGSWGGTVALLSPDSLGCWTCLEYHRHYDTVPAPPAHPNGWHQPPRCADQTFLGTHTDLATIVNHAVRVAVNYLTIGRPLGETDVHVASIRHTDGTPRTPVWNSVSLKRHPKCPHHSPSSNVTTVRQGTLST